MRQLSLVLFFILLIQHSLSDEEKSDTKSEEAKQKENEEFEKQVMIFYLGDLILSLDGIIYIFVSLSSPSVS